MAQAKFNVGAVLPDPDASVLVFPRSGDQYQPVFDVDAALDAVGIDDEGFVTVDGDEGENFWLYQETGKDDNGLSVGQQIAVTIPGEIPEGEAVIGGDDPLEKIAHDDAARALRDEAELQVHDPAAQEELKHASDPEPEPEPEPQEAKAEPKAKAKAKS